MFYDADDATVDELEGIPMPPSKPQPSTSSAPPPAKKKKTSKSKGARKEFDPLTPGGGDHGKLPGRPAEEEEWKKQENLEVRPCPPPSLSLSLILDLTVACFAGRGSWFGDNLPHQDAERVPVDQWPIYDSTG